MYCPSLDEFRAHAATGNLVPLYREILADMETPVSAFRKIDDGRTAFLLESIEGGEKWGRYSFLGSGPVKLFRSKGRYFEILDGEELLQSGECDDPLVELQAFLAPYRPVQLPGLPRFFGGAVGYLGYDMVRYVEELPDANPRQIDTWDACFLLTGQLLIFDSMAQKIKVVCNVHLQEGEDPELAYRRGQVAIDALLARLRRPLPADPPIAGKGQGRPLQPNFSRAGFMDAVERCKEYVRAGDIIQVVLSQRFSGQLAAEPFDVYRALRTINPSPYMFFLRFGATLVVGASPEVLVRKEGERVEVRPIAGTRPRGATPEEDRSLERELLADPKECAEHIMLVDLGRNDLGRVCRTGSVQVSELKVIERYSHVMHIVSNVRGTLEEGRDAFDLFRATFPAGTLSGAPKIRAMEIIDELEPCRREIYGGAVGYISYTGNMDLAIAIRTLVVQGETVHVQAGAGIVADSDPAAEYQETLNKARGVISAIELARNGLE
ncbi:anthranilate synthase component I [Desulfuromonas carbonis]|uniref:anthranilate synthase component I n=1 Tax=Desulfuromonas sp. DDH964 TaxID=1823759 RepID=UPI00078E88C8|nr:anthranilate synthase component I [Desulfuromonas sp. DDH964]AMV71571.1 anthranilate synthase, catalytic subunit [Desulfuromonas sp. DDH964]